MMSCYHTSVGLVKEGTLQMELDLCASLLSFLVRLS